MSFDPELARFWWEVFVTIVAGASAAITWWNRKAHANKTALDRVENGLNTRMERVENALNAGLSRVETHSTEKIAGISSLLRQQQDTFRSLMDDQSRRITVAEEALKFAPKSEDINRLRDSISDLANQVARFEGSQTSMARTVERMNDYLMEHGKT
jgi:chromosome segregation ATPase